MKTELFKNIFLLNRNFRSFITNSFVIFIISLQIFIFKPENYFQYLGILLINFLLLILFKKIVTNKFFLLYSLTLFIQAWSVLSTNLLYQPFHYDYGIFAVPVYQFINSEIFLNDMQTNMNFPHYPVYFVFSKIINLNYFNFLFFIFTVLQSNLFANIFYKLNLYHNSSEEKPKNFFFALPLIIQPLSAGLYTMLPYFLPSVFGFGLSSYILIKNLMLKEKVNLFWFVVCILIHPFWGLITPLFVFIVNIFEKKVSVSLFISFIFLLLSHKLIYSKASVSLIEVYELASSRFYDLNYTGKSHFYWFFAGNIIPGHLNIFVQIIPLAIAVYTFKIHKKLVFTYFTFLNIVRLSALLLIIINLFPYSFIHNISISTNFFRLGSYAWILTGVFIAKSNDRYVQFNSISSLLFSSYVFTKYFYESLTMEFVYFLSILFLLLFYKINQLKILQIFGLISILLIDFLIIPDMIISNFVLLFFIAYIVSIFLIKKNKIITYSHFLIYFIFLIIFFLPGNQKIDNKFSLEINRYLNTNTIDIIKENSDYNSLFLVNPQDKYFRRDVERSTLFTFNMVPYDRVSANFYLSFYDTFLNFDFLRFEEFEFLIENYQITHVLISIDHPAVDDLIDSYQKFIKLDKYILIIINS